MRQKFCSWSVCAVRRSDKGMLQQTTDEDETCREIVKFASFSFFVLMKFPALPEYPCDRRSLGDFILFNARFWLIFLCIVDDDFVFEIAKATRRCEPNERTVVLVTPKQLSCCCCHRFGIFIWITSLSSICLMLGSAFWNWNLSLVH